MKRGSILIAIILILVIVLSGCGGSNQATESVAVTPSGTDVSKAPSDTDSSNVPSNTNVSKTPHSDKDIPSGDKTRKLKAVEIIPEIPNLHYKYSDGMGWFTYNGKTGCLGEDGKIVVEPKYARGTLFSEGLALVKDANGNLIIIDKKGKEVFISEKYDLPGDMSTIKHGSFHNGAAIVSDKAGKQFIIIDKSGKELGVIDRTGYVPSGFLSCGVIVWSLNNSNKIKLTDATGKELTKEITTGFGANGVPVLNFNDNLLSIPDFDKSWNVIDTTGKKVFKENFEELGQPSEGLIAFKKYGKWGYIDYKGNVAIEPQYESAHNFSNGLAAVKVDGKIGFINNKNNMIIPPQFQEEPKLNLTTMVYYRFDASGIAIVPDNNGSFIDKSGTVFLSPESAVTILYGDGMINFFDNKSSKLYKVLEN